MEGEGIIGCLLPPEGREAGERERERERDNDNNKN